MQSRGGRELPVSTDLSPSFLSPTPMIPTLRAVFFEVIRRRRETPVRLWVCVRVTQVHKLGHIFQGGAVDEICDRIFEICDNSS